jgi:hypothetical protein
MSCDNFRKFHRNNPMVFHRVVQLTDKLRKKGRKHYNIEIILGVIRYDIDVDTVGDQFKINNNYKPFYARMLMDYIGDDDFFALRESIAGNHDYGPDIEYYINWKATYFLEINL